MIKLDSDDMIRGRSIVFDIDDTLYLERDYVRSGFVAAERASGIDGLAAECWRLFLDGVRGDTFNRALGALGHRSDRDMVRELVAVYRQHHPSIALLPDARRCLDRLDSCFLGIVSDGPIQSQRAKVQALGLDEYMSLVVLTGTLGGDFCKPHPRAFEMIQKESRIAPNCHMYVADNPAKDFRAPAALGWFTVRVRRPRSLLENVPTAGEAAVEVPDLDALPKLLADWAGFPGDLR